MNTKKNRLIAPTLLAAAVLALATGCASTAPQADDAGTPEPGPASNPIVGEWTMTTLEFQTDGEFAEVPFGGQIIFTDAGTVSVQAMNPDTTAPDTAYTVNGYEAFYGDATIDADAGTFSVEVTSAAARDLIGQTLSRNYEVTDETLVLTPVDAAEGWRVTYERETE